MSITGEKDENGGSPQKVGVAVADIMTGMYATVGILGALAHRSRTGEGQYIDVALLDCQIAMLANHTSNYLIGGAVPQRHGNEHVSIVPYQSFKTKDGDIILAIGNDVQFARFSALNKRDWHNDVRYKTNAARVKNRESLVSEIADIMTSKATVDWLALLEENSIPCGPVNNMDQALSDIHIQKRGLVSEITGEDGERVPIIKNPINYSKTPMQYTKAPPKLKL